MARDRPSPYGEGVAFFIVARGPVPRDRWIARTLARDRPSPYGEGVAFFIVARGPSDATRASERVSPASVRPTRKTHADQGRFPFRPRHDEGQALALRMKGVICMARDRFPSPYGERQENSRPDEHFVISRRIADENRQDNTGAIARNRRHLVDTPRVEKVKIALR